MANKYGSPSAEQHYYVNESTPDESDVFVGLIWVDPDTGTAYVCTSIGPIVFTALTGLGVLDDVILGLGNDNDGVLYLRSTVLGADTALTGVIVGTPVSEAIAADSLIISNITASGDIAMYGNRGGNSEQFLFMDVSAGALYLTPYLGGLMVALAADPPAPDQAGVHIWAATAGTLTSIAASLLTLENSGNAFIQFLTGDGGAAGIYVGKPTNGNNSAYLIHGVDAANTWSFAVNDVQQWRYTNGALAFQLATTISTTADALTLDPTTDVLIADGKGFIVGHTAGVAGGGKTAELQVLGSSGGDDNAILLGSFSTSITAIHGAKVLLLKSKTNTIGANVIVVDDEVLGGIEAYASDGVDFDTLVGRVGFEVDDAAPGVGVIGGALVLGVSTTNAVGTGLQERMRIHSDGVVGFSLATHANVNVAGAILPAGGLAFTDVANAWIDDATHGDGTVQHFIGNAPILVGNGVNFGPGGVTSITVVNGQITAIS